MITSRKNGFESFSEKETEDFAANFAKNVPWGTVVALHGELGAGKTVFARGFARGLGVKEAVTSPAFTLMQEYRLENGRRLYHLDLYRITDEKSAFAFGIEEYLEDPDGILLIEWPERIGKILSSGVYHILIAHSGKTRRKIRTGSDFRGVLPEGSDYQ